MALGAREIAEIVAAIFGLLAIVAGVADWRHKRRRDLDRVSLFDWRNLQAYALIGAGIALFAIVLV